MTGVAWKTPSEPSVLAAEQYTTADLPRLLAEAYSRRLRRAGSTGARAARRLLIVAGAAKAALRRADKLGNPPSNEERP